MQTDTLTETIFKVESTQFGVDRVRDACCVLDNMISSPALAHLTDCSIRQQALQLKWFLYSTNGVHRRMENVAERFTLTGTLLNRGGSCLGMTTLYVCMGERLGLPLRPNLFECHIAVAHCGIDPPLHLETTRRGTILPRRWVRRLYGEPLSPRLLTNEQFIAVHLSNRAAFVLTPQGNFDEAIHLFESSLELFPTYVAGFINHATLSLALGNHAVAAESLARAKTLEPRERYQQTIKNLQTQLGESTAIRSATNMNRPKEIHILSDVTK